MSLASEALLAFPVTLFDERDHLDVKSLTEHLDQQVAARPDALVLCGGTGEYYSLGLDEYEALLEIAVALAQGAVPIFAAVGHGGGLGRQFLAVAHKAGVQGVLAMPPQRQLPTDAVMEYFTSLATASELPTIVYQRPGSALLPTQWAKLAELGAVIGLKDATGDLGLVDAQRRIARDGMVYLNGTPTAEYAQLAYDAIGVRAYSSAVHCFSPQISRRFYEARLANDEATIDQLWSEFFSPLVELRRQGRGYEVGLVKAGVKLRGLGNGRVRSPYVEAAPEHQVELLKLIEAAELIVANTENSYRICPKAIPSRSQRR